MNKRKQPMKTDGRRQQTAVEVQLCTATAARAHLLSSEPADVKLLCKHRKEVLAHKALLRLVSPVWRGMLDDVGDCSTIPVTDAKAAVVEQVMCLIYPIAQKPSIHWGNVESLTAFAHKYNIDSILSRCTRFLESCTFSYQASATGGMKPWQERRHAMRWLRLAEGWGMHSIVDKCISTLLVCSCPSSDSDSDSDDYDYVPDEELPPRKVVRPALVRHLRDEAFLRTLRPATLIKLVRAMAELG